MVYPYMIRQVPSARDRAQLLKYSGLSIPCLEEEVKQARKIVELQGFRNNEVVDYEREQARLDAIKRRLSELETELSQDLEIGHIFVAFWKSSSPQGPKS